MVSNEGAFGCGQYTIVCGTPFTLKSQLRNCPTAIGESNNNSTDEAANTFGSLVGSSPEALAQPLGKSSVTRVGTAVAPTTYMNECRSPTSPPVADRNGFQAARAG